MGQVEDLRAWMRRDWMCLLVLWEAERRSAGSVLRMVIARSLREAVEMAEERLQGPLVGRESSFVVGEAVAEVQRTPRDFGKALRMFGRVLRLQLLRVDSQLRLPVEESFLDAGSFLGPLELRDYMLMEQSWMLPDSGVLLRLVGQGKHWW